MLDVHCRPEEFCELEIGCELGTLGECVLAVDDGGACASGPGAYECGCDGGLYSNSCERRAARVSRNHDGTCGAPVEGCDPFVSSCHECLADGDCPNPDEFCEKSEDACGIFDVPGICVHSSDCSGPTIDGEVCGCDGRFYPNDCVRRGARVSRAQFFMCDSTGGSCTSVFDCPRTHYCEIGDAVCGSPGVCAPRNLNCFPEYAPVCGCDGLMYENRCAAGQFGVSVGTGTGGELCAAAFCDATPGSLNGCVDTYYCATSGGCGEGICVRRPLGGECGAEGSISSCTCSGRYLDDCTRRIEGLSIADDATCAIP
jgi:hypothetical protein